MNFNMLIQKAINQVRFPPRDEFLKKVEQKGAPAIHEINLALNEFTYEKLIFCYSIYFGPMFTKLMASEIAEKYPSDYFKRLQGLVYAMNFFVVHYLIPQVRGLNAYELNELMELPRHMSKNFVVVPGWNE